MGPWTYTSYLQGVFSLIYWIISEDIKKCAVANYRPITLVSMQTSSQINIFRILRGNCKIQKHLNILSIECSPICNPPQPFSEPDSDVSLHHNDWLWERVINLAENGIETSGFNTPSLIIIITNTSEKKPTDLKL